jgi:hypothetical protein
MVPYSLKVHRSASWHGNPHIQARRSPGEMLMNYPLLLMEKGISVFSALATTAPLPVSEEHKFV